MTSTTQLAKHLRDVHFGGNWTTTNLKDLLTDISWQQATQKIAGLNTIATLTYHTGYFISALTDVLEGRPLTSKDIYSFDHPPIHNAQDWQNLIGTTLDNAEHASRLIEKLPEAILYEDFANAKYGNYFRNILGIIEHTHYHLGQISLIKKLVQRDSKS